MLLSKYGVARHVYIPIIKRGAVDFAVGADWTPAAGDVRISKDGGASGNVSNLPVAIAMNNGAMWDFSLTALEMQAAQVVVMVVDSAAKAVEDQSFIIETYGDPAAQHEFDLDTPLAANVSAIKAKTDFLPSIAAGAAGGVFIAGTNAPVTITGSGDALTLASTGANGSGLKTTGNGTGHGIDANSGAGATGNGIRANAASTDGYGIRATGHGTGSGLLAQGGATANGFEAVGGSTSGSGMYATAAAKGHGIRAIGVVGVGGGDDEGHGIVAQGGANDSNDGIRVKAPSAGGLSMRNVTTGTNRGIFDTTLVPTPPTTAQIASAAWDEPIGGHGVPFSTGSLLLQAEQAAATAQTQLLGVIQGGFFAGDTGNDTTHIQLGLPQADDELNGLSLVIFHAGDYYIRWIEDWVQSTGVATVALLPFVPSTSDFFYVINGGRRLVNGATAGKMESHELAVLTATIGSGSTTTAVKLATVNGAAPSAVNDFYNGAVLVITSGTLNGQRTVITDYDGPTTTATVVAMTAAPANGSTAIIV